MSTLNPSVLAYILSVVETSAIPLFPQLGQVIFNVSRSRPAISFNMPPSLGVSKTAVNRIKVKLTHYLYSAGLASVLGAAAAADLAAAGLAAADLAALRSTTFTDQIEPS